MARTDPKSPPTPVPQAPQALSAERSPAPQGSGAQASVEPPMIPGYRLFERLGAGGVGSVYRARSVGGQTTVPELDVAIKVFPARESWVPDEFLRETSALRRRHDHLVALLNAGWTEDHRPFIVMEYVPGEDVRARLSRGPLPLREALGLMIDVFCGLDAMHRAGLIHGDVKPENVRVDGGRARLVDMGRTRLVRDVQPGEVFPGTRPYMRPSLFHGGQPDEQSDCFAAWVMCYELINHHRPYLPEDLERCTDDALPMRYDLRILALEELVEAGLSGRVCCARLSRVALERYLLDGVAEIPAPRPERDLPAGVSGLFWSCVREMRSLALVGGQEGPQAREPGAALLERLERRWSGTTLRARPEWVSGRQPLAGALGLVVQASLALPMPVLLQVREQIGPLGEVLAEVVPAARAWLERGARVSPTAAQIRLAILSMVRSCPKPQLILVEGMDRLDSASRRVMTELAICPDVLVVGTSLTADHGMPVQIDVGGAGAAPAPGLDLLPAGDRALLARAAALELPLGSLLARAAGVEIGAVERAARLAEVRGLAAWDGAAVIPARVPVDPADRSTWAREAAARLDPREHCLLVARYARIAGDTARLLSVIEPAAAMLAVFDPAQALELLDHQPEPWALPDLQRRFDLAIQAREIARARELLERMRAMSGPGGSLGVDEAEMELLFQEGRVEEARQAANRAMIRIGRPLPESNLQAAIADGAAFFRLIWRGLRRTGWSEPGAPGPERTLIARLHDLHFLSDNRLMMHIHRRWVESSPGDWRARAMDLVWYSALGMRRSAARLEERLMGDARLETAGPLAEAIILAHRGIGRLLRGETSQAFSDGLDASRRLLRVGDSYCASLAATVVWAAGYHLGEIQPMREIAADLARVADLAHDGKARAWVSGGSAVIAWLEGDLELAILQTERWIDAADGRDSSGALALRFLGELYLDQGRPEEAIPCFERSVRLMQRYNLVTDHCHAVYLSMGIADGQLRRLGKPPRLRRWWHGPLIGSLLWRSPRWRPRALVAEAWCAGDLGEARDLFLQAVNAARELGHPRDEQWILEQAALMERMERPAGAPGSPARQQGDGP